MAENIVETVNEKEVRLIENCLERSLKKKDVILFCDGKALVTSTWHYNAKFRDSLSPEEVFPSVYVNLLKRLQTENCDQRVREMGLSYYKSSGEIFIYWESEDYFFNSIGRKFGEIYFGEIYKKLREEGL